METKGQSTREQATDFLEKRPWLNEICDSQSTEELKDKYDSWASTYDADLEKDWSFMPVTIARTLAQLLKNKPNAAILDAGAGTGLVGEALSKQGYKNLTAVDLSEKMLALAKEKNIYQDLYRGNFPLFEATTRSNLLILSIEDAIKRRYSEAGKAMFAQAIGECDRLRTQLDTYGQLLTYDPDVNDPLKIFLKSDRVLGTELADILFDLGLDGEFANEEGLLLLFSFNHSQEDFQFIRECLATAVPILKGKAVQTPFPVNYFSRCPQIKVLPNQAFFSPKEKLSLDQALGRISGSCIKKIPPGSPILIPGEEVTAWHLNRLPPDTVVEVVGNMCS